MNLSIRSLFITFLFIINFVIFFLLKKNILRVVFIFLWFLTIIYLLFNYAYYKVFEVFLTIGYYAGQFNESFINLLKDYYYLIPWHIFLLASLLFFSIFAVIFLLDSKEKEAKPAVNFLTPVIKEKKVKYCLAIGLFFIIINFTMHFTIDYFKSSFKAENFSKIGYISDLGIYGHIFDNFTEKTKSLLNIGTLQAGSEEEDNLDLKKKKVQIIKERMKDLLKLSGLNKAQGKYEVKKLNNPNIIIYQMESVSSWPLKQDPSPMPFLSKMMKENISVEHFFANSCNTVNTEFTSLCSFFPDSFGPISDLFSFNNYYCLPSILKKNFGYTTSMFHANQMSFWNRTAMAPKWGFDNFFFSPDYYKIRQSDGDVVDDAIERIKESEDPYFAYLIGFTSHSPHNKEFAEFNRELNNLNIEPYPYELNDISRSVKLDEESLRYYLGFLKYIDKTIEQLFAKLAADDLLSNTVVIIYGDHKYYNIDINSQVDNFLNYHEIPLAIYIPDSYLGEIRQFSSHLDIAPTILDIINQGNDYLPENFLGQSLFSDGYQNSAINKCLGQAFYVDSNIAVNYYQKFGLSESMTFFKNKSEEKFDNYVNDLKQIVKLSDLVLEEDLLGPPGDIVTDQPESKLVLLQETDTDNDGLSDLREEALGTDKLNPDSDGDGFSDGQEVINGYDPLSDSEFKIGEKTGLETDSVLRPSSNLNNFLVAHALGDVEGAWGSNSYEAFLENYQRGFRFFEVDLSLTQDGQVAAFHNGYESYLNLDKKVSQITYKEFKKLQFGGKYTLLGFEDLIDIMEDYSDVYFILDFKDDLASIFERINSYLKDSGNLNLYERIIPQIYQPLDLEVIKRYNDFRDIIFTLYRTDMSDSEVVEFVKDSDITAVAMTWDNRYSKEFANKIKNIDAAVFVHTVNIYKEIKKFINSKINVYVDSVED